MDFSWKEIAKAESAVALPEENFWSGVTVWINRPHLLNPKILAAEPLKTWMNFSDNVELLHKLNSGNFSVENLKDSFQAKLSSDLAEVENHISLKDDIFDPNLLTKSTDEHLSLLLRNLLPKQIKVYQCVLEAVLVDKLGDCVTFYPNMDDVRISNITPAFPYRLKKINNGLTLEVLETTEEKSHRHLESEKWLKEKVLGKILRWSEYVPKQPVIPSLRLIPLKIYHSNLNELKMKYGKNFVKIWPEYNNTDPGKFVYEDISTASYLITLWAEERKKFNLEKKQSFVDLGCGNGFLAHILSAEGHPGIGLDLRKRKMWNAYGSETKLYEMTYEPSDNQLYPEYDWIIGNHSDELTPWIPVIAARSSYKTKAFIVPCCAYTFNGKYVRKNHNISQYQSYLNFVEELSSAMGFSVERDRLRIPSTKRVCFVCSERNYAEVNEKDIDVKRTEYIEKNKKLSQFNQEKELVSHNSDCSTSSTNWISDFAPRNYEEKTQNCTNIDRNILKETIDIFFNALLSTENYTTINRDGATISWNRGGKLKMADLLKLLSPETIKCLKNQRGGFQTLLRNYGYIFEVKDSTVQLKVPSENTKIPPKTVQVAKHLKKQKKIPFKTKKCFYFFNHPQGCPSSSSDCAYSHEECLN